MFTFSATDSRGFNTTQEVKPPYVEYVKLSCYAEYEPVKADTGILDFDIKGNYYNGTFGAVDNNLAVLYRIKEEEEAWSEWKPATATLQKHTYTAKVSVSGLDYRKTYHIQANATDRLNTITSVEYTLTTVPVFDWSKTDFNFNVPVSFQGDLLEDMVIESGSESMGSNGTWYWRKWKSGKAECWGQRNFGNMGFGTAFGAMYQSAVFDQPLPSIFNAIPQTINIDILKSNGASWVLRGIDADMSKDSTGGFALCKPTNTTLSQVYLGFYAVGVWK